MAVEQYDAILIGSGQAAYPLAMSLIEADWDTVLIECNRPGGTCVNTGCTPTKTMIASARVAYLARRGPDYGVEAGPVSVDMKVVRQRKRDMVNSSANYLTEHAEELDAEKDNFTYLKGVGRFTGPKTVEVEFSDGSTRTLGAEKIFINVGTRTRMPDIEGIDQVPFLNNETIMELDEVPAHLLIVGGGYIGLEFGQMFRRFGSEVTIVQRGEQLLSREDADIAGAVADILREDGIEVLLETDTKSVEQQDDGQIALTVITPEGERTLTGSHILIAAGRALNSDTLNLEAAGIKIGRRGAIKTNEKLETNVPGVYALGDVKGGPAFTHISYDDFRIIRTNLLEGGDASISDRLVPYTVFMDPQLGRVGLSEKMAKSQGTAYRVAKMPMSSVARAREMDETRGLMKVLVDPETGQILGVAILGVEGGEIMSVLQVAMMGRLPYTAIKDGVFAHPTLTESLNNLFSNVE